MKTPILTALALTTLTSAGCMNLRYATNAVPEANAHTEWTHYHLMGAIGEADVDLDERCPQGVARVHTYVSFANGLATIFPGVLGLFWAPRTLEITCASKGA